MRKKPYGIFSLRYAMIIFMLIAASATTVSAQEDLITPIDTLNIGETLPFKPLPTLTGRNINLSSYKGKVVVLAFWLQYCKTCMTEISKVNKFLSDGKHKDVVFITISRGKQAERSILRNQMKLNGLNLPVITDENLFISRKFGVNIAPSFILLDKSGKIATPPINFSETPIRDFSLLKMINILLKGEAIPEKQFIPHTETETHYNMIGSAAPLFELNDIQGDPHTLISFRNKSKVVLVFINPYAPEGREVVMRLNSFYTSENIQKYNFTIFAMFSIYGPSQMYEATNLYEEIKPNFPFLNDEQSKVGSKYSIIDIPSFVFIDREGNISDIMRGEDELEKRMAVILKTMK